jgi:hypothetical protein
MPLIRDVKDYSGNGNHGNQSGISYSTIKTGQRISTIDSDADYITLTNSISNTHLTVCMWYYYDGNEGTWNTLLCRNGGTYHHLLVQPSDSQIGFYNSTFYGSGVILEKGNWYFLRLVKNGTNSKLYINEELVQDSNSSFDNATYPLAVIGNDGSYTQGSRGNIKNVLMFDGEPSYQLFKNIYNATRLIPDK